MLLDWVLCWLWGLGKWPVGPERSPLWSPGLEPQASALLHVAPDYSFDLCCSKD